jgi:hypothetical protein
MFLAEAMKPHSNRKGELHDREKRTSYHFAVVFTLRVQSEITVLSSAWIRGWILLTVLFNYVIIT